MTEPMVATAGAHGRSAAASAISSALTVVGVPFLVYVLYFLVGFNDGAIVPGSGVDIGAYLESIIPTLDATIVFLGWIAAQAFLYVALPGRVVEGLPLIDGTRLRYRLNGMLALAITLTVLGIGQVLGWFELSWVADHVGALLSVATVFTFAVGGLMYWWGRRFPDGPPRERRDPVTDYLMGTALNPRWRDLDFKFFFESRPGLIGWLVIDLGFAASQFERHGQLTLAMIVVVALQAFYIGAYFWSEQGVLSMIDITTERFGWMLVYGDAAFVPFAYSLQAYYLVDHVPDLPLWFAVVIVALFGIGFYIFRTANSQKDRFRRDPDGTRIWGKPATYITTVRGTPLLTSGFWGLARHMNYFGDWLMALSFSLTTMFGTIVTYFYPIFLGMLFISRQRRDERWCQLKYGPDWDRYRQIVRWRIVPRIY